MVTSRYDQVLGEIKDHTVNKGVAKLETSQGIREGYVKDMKARVGIKRKEIFASKKDIPEIGGRIIKVFKIRNEINLMEECPIRAQKFSGGLD